MERDLERGNRGHQKITIATANEAKLPKETTAGHVEKVQDQGKAMAKLQESKQYATFVDLERGRLDAQEGEADTGCCTNLYIFVLYGIVTIVAAVLFMKIPFWPAALLTSFMVGMARGFSNHIGER
ncbi:unnamed protein product [Urochloa humidicola]